MGGGVGRKGTQHGERVNNFVENCTLNISSFPLIADDIFLNLKPCSGTVYMAFKGVNRESRTSAYRSQGLYLLKLISTPKNGQKMNKNTQNLLFYH